jgi:hypothetical protein
MLLWTTDRKSDKGQLGNKSKEWTAQNWVVILWFIEQRILRDLVQSFKTVRNDKQMQQKIQWQTKDIWLLNVICKDIGGKERVYILEILMRITGLYGLGL